MITIAGDTHPGRVRANNEDAFLADPGRALAVVADGMGGHASGEIASQITIDTFTAQGDGAALADMLLAAHRHIAEHARAHPQCAGMGATAVAARADARHYRISWVGDSRAYHWRPGAGLRRISRDHSYLEWLLSQGQISEAEARNHPQRNVVTQGLGLNEPEPESREGDWAPRDRLLLCSDGLTDELDDAEIDALLNAAPDLGIAVAALIDAALKSGGRDNISVVLLENNAPASAAPTPRPSWWSTLWPILAGVAGALAVGFLLYLSL